MKRIDNLKIGDRIGVTAPSDGFSENVDYVRLENAKMNLEERGYEVVETPSVRSSMKGRSASPEIRAKEFMELMEDDAVKYIVSACGGDFLMEILPHLDFKKIKENPKWIQGYSDNTGLVFPITTNCDFPTIYAGNIGDYGMANWHKAVHQNIEILEGKLHSQQGFDLFENDFTEKITGLEGYNLSEKVEYTLLGGEKSAAFSGVLLGGCLDVLMNLCGTKYDNTASFVKNYRNEGIIWYMESFALSSARLEMALLQLKEAGWFEGARGFLFGRPCFFKEEYETSFNEAVTNALKDLNVPIIAGCDIGHRPPRLTMINGLMAEASIKEGEFRLTYLKNRETE